MGMQLGSFIPSTLSVHLLTYTRLATSLSTVRFQGAEDFIVAG